MATATRSKRSDTKTGSARVREARREMRREALTAWRSWAVSLADGGPFPKVAELLAAATILQIKSPAEALESDAGALKEFAAARKAAGACETTLAKMLEPFGGDREKLVAAVDAAEAEAKRMRELLNSYDGGSGLFHWTFTMNAIHRSNKRCFAEFDDELLADHDTE